MSPNLQAVSDPATDQNFRQIESEWPSDSGWNTPTFQNSWANYETGWAPAAYRKGVDGRVTIRGLVKHAGATGTSTIFTLPAGFRPSKQLIFAQWGAPSATPLAMRVDVNSAGEVQVQAPAVVVEYLSLNLSFYPD